MLLPASIYTIEVLHVYILSMFHLEVAGSSDRRSTTNRHILNRNNIASGTGDLYRHSGSAGATRDLEEIVRLPCRRKPGFATIRTNTHARYGLVGIHDLHTEPVCRYSIFVVQLKRCRDRTVDIAPGDRNDTFRLRGQCAESCGEEIEMVGAAAGTFINDLESY